MNKASKIFIISIIVLIILFLSLLSLKSVFKVNDLKNQGMQTDNIQEQADLLDETNLSGLKNFDINLDQACTYNYTDTNTENPTSVLGDVFIQGGGKSILVKYETEAADVKTSGSVVIKNEKMYMWTDSSKDGFIYDLSDSEQDNETFPLSSFDMNDIASSIKAAKDSGYDISCTSNSTSADMFELPSDINFQDLSTIVSDAMEDAGVDCTICQSLSDDAKAACLNALSCD